MSTTETFTREYLKGLKKAADLKEYNHKLTRTVSIITESILLAATKGSTELSIRVWIIPIPQKGSLNLSAAIISPNTIDVYDVEMVQRAITELKTVFVDTEFEYQKEGLICITWN
jgi:hypothetical protein